MKFNIIVAVGNYVEGKGYPIGKNGKLPWHFKEDLKWFKETTIGYPVIMGRKTWESLSHPLVDRECIVITHNYDIIKNENVYVVDSLENAISLAENFNKEKAFIIGGASIYNEALYKNKVDSVYMDMLSIDIDDADTFFDIYGYEQICVEEKALSDKCYVKIINLKQEAKTNDVDYKYFNLVEDILRNGEVKETRAGKTLSVFGRQIRFNLKNGLPLLTTKKIFTKGIIYELLWFIKGDTNIKYLIDNGVHIWDDDAYRFYLELCKKHKWGQKFFITKDEFLELVREGKTIAGVNYVYKYGDLNNIYGAQWTNWGGHNQINEIIEKLKTSPNDRRLIISAWNVEDIPNMALPPCHFSCQFYTKEMTQQERINYLKTHFNDNSWNGDLNILDNLNIPKRKLSCMFHMRSNDIGCGAPFNWASYAIFTHMIAQCVNMDVDELIYEVGDAHIYENHKDALYEQLKRCPWKYSLPSLELNPGIKNILDFKYEDIKIKNYSSYPVIKLPINVGL